MRIAWLYDCELAIDPWFALILAVAGLGGYLPEALILLGVLLTHELAHLIVGRGFGLEFRRIDLLPYGGVAHIDNLYAVHPSAVAVTALAGPFNNLLLLAASYGLAQQGWIVPPTSDFLIRVNLGLALFNLLPALPLDGGRILQSVLRERLGEIQAIKRLVWWGYWIAACLVLGSVIAALFGIFLPTVPVLAFFVVVGARRETMVAIAGQLRRLWQRPEELARRRTMPAAALVATEDVTIRHIIPHLTGSRYYLVWVLDRNFLPCGRLSETEIIQAALDGHLNQTLGELLR